MDRMSNHILEILRYLNVGLDSMSHEEAQTSVMLLPNICLLSLFSNILNNTSSGNSTRYYRHCVIFIKSLKLSKMIQQMHNRNDIRLVLINYLIKKPYYKLNEHPQNVGEQSQFIADMLEHPEILLNKHPAKLGA